MGIFDGAKDVDIAGTGGLPPLTPGDYILQIDKNDSFLSENPATEGQGMFVAEFTVAEVLRETEESLGDGARCKFMQMLERGVTGKLTTKGKRNFERVKQYASAVLADPDTGEPATAAAIDSEALEDMCAEGGEALAGLKIIAKVTPMINRKTGERYTTKKGIPLSVAAFYPLPVE